MSRPEFARYLQEIERTIRAAKPEIPEAVAKAYIGGGVSALRFHGLKVPQVQSIAKAGFSFLGTDEAAALKLWNYVWRESEWYEVMSLALVYYGHKRRSADILRYWPTLKGWVGRIDNWAHSDGLSSLYARALELDRKKVLPTLEEWSEAEKPWLRRQSLVSLLYYSAARSEVLPFRKLAAMVTKQLHFDHYYVQKGVGWTLREMGNVYPAETLKYLRAHAEELSAAAFSAATEKLPKDERERLKAARRQARQR